MNTNENEAPIEELEENEPELCINCECKIKYFQHNCNGTPDFHTVLGCPNCDDHCGFCED